MASKKLFLASTVLFVLFSLPLLSSVGASSEMWSKSYGGAEYDSAYSLVETSDGGYALAGYTTSFGAGDGDFWLVKTDAYGNMLWNRTYGGKSIDIARSLVETSDGGYALAGGNRLVKTDEYGNIEWNHTYNGGSAISLIETFDGGFALAGETTSFGAGSSDFWLVRTDEYGIPEFPSWVILPLFLTVTLVVAIYRRKLSKTGKQSIHIWSLIILHC